MVQGPGKKNEKNWIIKSRKQRKVIFKQILPYMPIWLRGLDFWTYFTLTFTSGVQQGESSELLELLVRYIQCEEPRTGP